MEAEAVGEIQSTSLYTLREVQRRLGIGAGTIRSWRRQGFRLLYLGRNAYIHGRDVIEWIERHAHHSR